MPRVAKLLFLSRVGRRLAGADRVHGAGFRCAGGLSRTGQLLGHAGPHGLIDARFHPWTALLTRFLEFRPKQTERPLARAI